MNLRPEELLGLTRRVQEWYRPDPVEQEFPVQTPGGLQLRATVDDYVGCFGYGKYIERNDARVRMLGGNYLISIANYGTLLGKELFTPAHELYEEATEIAEHIVNTARPITREHALSDARATLKMLRPVDEFEREEWFENRKLKIRIDD